MISLGSIWESKIEVVPKFSLESILVIIGIERGGTEVFVTRAFVDWGDKIAGRRIAG